MPFDPVEAELGEREAGADADGVRGEAVSPGGGLADEDAAGGRSERPADLMEADEADVPEILVNDRPVEVRVALGGCIRSKNSSSCRRVTPVFTARWAVISGSLSQRRRVFEVKRRPRKERAAHALPVARRHPLRLLKLLPTNVPVLGTHHVVFEFGEATTKFDFRESRCSS